MNKNLSRQGSELRKEQGRKSLLAFARLYFAEHLKLKPSAAHCKIYELLLSMTQKGRKKVAIVGPRSFGKSTLVTMIFIAYCIVYQLERFIVIVSETVPQAELILDNLKRELRGNEKLLLDFPELSGSLPTPWTQKEIELPMRIRVLARGTGQTLRGLRYGKDRPGLIVLDDIESDSKVTSMEAREKLRRWFNSEVLKLGEIGETNVLFLGTLQHADCLIGEYVAPDKNPDWIKRVYRVILSWSTRTDLWEKWSLIYNFKESYEEASGPEAGRKYYEANKDAMNENVKLLWDEKWDYLRLMEMREEDPVSFSSELQNDPMNPKDCVFDVENFHAWNDRYRSIPDVIETLGTHGHVLGACDPSTGVDQKRGDPSAIGVAVRDDRDGLVYLLQMDTKKRKGDEIIEDILAYHRRYHFESFAFESNQFQGYLADCLEKRSRQLGLHLPIVRVKNTTDKIRRIQWLQPLLKKGDIQVNRNLKVFLDECRYFPKGRHDDGLDALEMIMRLVKKGRSIDIFFTHENDSKIRDINGFGRSMGWFRG